MAHRLDQSTRAISRSGYRARFFPSGFFISSNIHSRQKNILLIYTGRALFTRIRNLGVINLARENHVDIICLPPHSSHKMQPLDKLSRAPENILLPRNLKVAPFTPRASRHRLPNWLTVRKCTQANCNRRNSS